MNQFFSDSYCLAALPHWSEAQWNVMMQWEYEWCNCWILEQDKRICLHSIIVWLLGVQRLCHYQYPDRVWMWCVFSGCLCISVMHRKWSVHINILHAATCLKRVCGPFTRGRGRRYMRNKDESRDFSTHRYTYIDSASQRIPLIFFPPVMLELQSP